MADVADKFWGLLGKGGDFAGDKTHVAAGTKAVSVTETRSVGAPERAWYEFGPDSWRIPSLVISLGGILAGILGAPIYGAVAATVGLVLFIYSFTGRPAKGGLGKHLVADAADAAVNLPTMFGNILTGDVYKARVLWALTPMRGIIILMLLILLAYVLLKAIAKKLRGKR